MYSTFQDLIRVIAGLQPGTAVIVTTAWCTQYGLNVNSALVKIWGKKLKQEYFKHNLIFTHKSSNNLCHYQRI